MLGDVCDQRGEEGILAVEQLKKIIGVSPLAYRKKTGE